LDSGYDEHMDSTEIRQLLYELCVDLGFCLPPAEQSQLEKNPPDDADSFARAVFVAEGLNPDHAGRHLYRQVRNRVVDAMNRSAERREMSSKLAE
jgi:hypothetical protein